MTKRILFAGGGTGGHVYPIIAVAEELGKMVAESKIPIEFHYFGSRGRHAPELQEAGVQFHSIMTGKLRRYFSLLNILDVPKFFIGLIQTWVKMFFLMPDVIFSKGGPGALPVVWVGWFYRIPVIIHESDARPGLTTLLSAPFATRIALSFKEAMQYVSPRKSFLSGNPIRREVAEVRDEEGGAAKESLGFDAARPLTVVVGGSQGSQRVDEFVVVNLPALLPLTQILLQAGAAHIAEVEKLSKAVLVDVPVKTEAQNRFKAVPYLEKGEWGRALAAADVVIARAGASTLAELAMFGTPSILIPLEGAARDHQRVNAYAYAEGGAAVVIEEANLNIHILAQELKKILLHDDVKEKMRQSARAFAKPEAAHQVAKEIIGLIH